ncbi:hypothetical protein [Burkholderia sp. Ac-20365]|uniref:hypothetical protein n=1 Tax=Burkholderia sp. Ac-20365 TaxID=2703897 RepID=UPI00197BBC59|nr:hypothetical protein [Burkholderia sp. Ac-20365]
MPADERRHIDAVGPLPRFGRIEHRRAALSRDMHSTRHWTQHKLCDTVCGAQMADFRQSLMPVGVGTLREKIAGRSRARTTRVRVSDRRCKELKEAHACQVCRFFLALVVRCMPALARFRTLQFIRRAKRIRHGNGRITCCSIQADSFKLICLRDADLLLRRFSCQRAFRENPSNKYLLFSYSYRHLTK